MRDAAKPCQTIEFRIQTALRPIELHVKPLRLLVSAFVNTFGITPPTPDAEARAGRVIAIMLATVLMLLGAVAWILRAVLTH
jgi:hypothetical protein